MAAIVNKWTIKKNTIQNLKQTKNTIKYLFFQNNSIVLFLIDFFLFHFIIFFFSLFRCYFVHFLFVCLNQALSVNELFSTDQFLIQSLLFLILTISQKGTHPIVGQECQ